MNQDSRWLTPNRRVIHDDNPSVSSFISRGQLSSHPEPHHPLETKKSCKQIIAVSLRFSGTKHRPIRCRWQCQCRRNRSIPKPCRGLAWIESLGIIKLRSLFFGCGGSLDAGSFVIDLNIIVFDRVESLRLPQ